MAKYDAIIFDWDGVIYDSISSIAQNCINVCKSYGVEIDAEYYKAHFSQPHWIFYKNLGIPANTEQEREEIGRRYWDFHIKDGTEHQIFYDVQPALEKLKEKELHLGIISAGLENTIKTILKKEGLDKFFADSDIIARADHKSDRIKEFCERNNFALQRALMVGDLPSDIENGKEAGVDTAGLARFPSAIDRLKKHNPDYVFETLDNLLEII